MFSIRIFPSWIDPTEDGSRHAKRGATGPSTFGQSFGQSLRTVVGVVFINFHNRNEKMTIRSVWSELNLLRE